MMGNNQINRNRHVVMISILGQVRFLDSDVGSPGVVEVAANGNTTRGRR